MTKDKPLIYFAHPYTTRGTPTEKRIAEILSERYEVLDPFVEEGGLEIKHGGKYYEVTTSQFAKDVVATDYQNWKRCDEYFGWFVKGEAMIGTTCELMWSLHAGKPITVLCYKYHPFLLEYSVSFYTTIKSLAEWKPFDKQTLKVVKK